MGITQVSAAVSQLDDATQQNATLVEQGAASADALRREAHDLEQLVQVFATQEPHEEALGPPILRAALSGKLSRAVPDDLRLVLHGA